MATRSRDPRPLLRGTARARRRIALILIATVLLAAPTLLATAWVRPPAPSTLTAADFRWFSTETPGATTVGPTAWVLPEPSSTGAHDRLAVDDAVSVTSFPLTALSFTATFPSLGATRGHPSNFSDELVVFAATDVTDYHGYEFGVRESLSDGAVFAYWQSPSAGGIVVFHETPLFASDGRVHAFDLVRVGPALVFIVDGARTVTAAFPTAPTSGFFVVTTAHRASDGWSAPGLALSVADLSESSGGL